jgi:hypothetical protein
MVDTRWMRDYVQMFWAKKIMEWSPLSDGGLRKARSRE